MNEMKHTPEPWEYGFDEYGGYDCCSAGYIILSAEQHICTIDVGDYEGKSNHIPNEAAEANAERIVSCVNACAGINPEAVPELLAEHRQWARDFGVAIVELLQGNTLSLAELATQYRLVVKDGGPFLESAAIAKATGEGG